MAQRPVRAALGSYHPKTLIIERPWPPCQMSFPRVQRQLCRAWAKVGPCTQSCLLASSLLRLKLWVQVNGPGSLRCPGLTSDWFGPAGVSWAKPIPWSWHVPLPRVPLLIEHSPLKGELRSSHTVGRGQGCRSQVLERVGEEGPRSLVTHMAVAPPLCKAELSAIS